MEHKNGMCADMETKLAELLLDPETVPASVKQHVDACEGCRGEMESLRATMGVLDTWDAPEPNPYWMTRFEARLREEEPAKRANWVERVRSRILFGSGMHVKPLAAMGFTLALLVGGGTYLDLYWMKTPTVAPQTAVVHDLQTLDNNAQLLDELENITQPDVDEPDAN